MTAYMPPISRKKRVDERYNPDSFRVMSTDAEGSHPKYEPPSYRATFEPPTPSEPLFPDINCRRTRVLPKPTADFRANKPHPKSCSFIRTDVRLLNEPVCSVFTKETQPQQHSWWPSRANEGTLEKGNHTLDTIYRNDYLYTNNLAPQASYRHSANPNTTASSGIAPVNFMRERDGQQGVYKESVSFEHQYNSRVDPNYPTRGKRHGAFVYSKMDEQNKQKFIDYHTQLNQESQMAVHQASNTATNQNQCASPPKLSHSSPRKQSPKASPKVPSAEMMPTSSSPIEWYDPAKDTLKAQKPASTPAAETAAAPPPASQ